MILVLGIVAAVALGAWLLSLYHLWGGVGNQAVSGAAALDRGEPERRPTLYDHGVDEELTRALWRDEAGAA